MTSLTDLLAAAQDRLWADFRTAGVFEHRGTIGATREQALISFLEQQLPARFGVASGEVIDVGGRRSGQVDVFVYDRAMNALLSPSDRNNAILPVEALLAAIEVKSTLTRDEVKKTLSGMRRLYELQPWASSWGYGKRGRSSNHPRFLATCLAFKSDLSADWNVDEIRRIREVAKAEGIPTAFVDSVAILERGMVRPSDGLVAREPENRSVLGMWYFGLLNFLVREADRREPVPWSLYEEAVGRIWDQQLSPIEDAPPEVKRGSAARKRYIRRGRSQGSS